MILPPAIHFLTNFDSPHYTILIRARDYYRFAGFVLLGVALAFEVPVFVLALVRLRILSAATLRSTWRFGVFVMTVIGVLLPGVDPVSTILSVIPLVTLYVHLNFCPLSGLLVFQVSPNDVIRLAGGKTMGELAAMV